MFSQRIALTTLFTALLFWANLFSSNKAMLLSFANTSSLTWRNICETEDGMFYTFCRYKVSHFYHAMTSHHNSETCNIKKKKLWNMCFNFLTPALGILLFSFLSFSCCRRTIILVTRSLQHWWLVFIFLDSDIWLAYCLPFAFYNDFFYNWNG